MSLAQLQPQLVAKLSFNFIFKMEAEVAFISIFYSHPPTHPPVRVWIFFIPTMNYNLILIHMEDDLCI